MTEVRVLPAKQLAEQVHHEGDQLVTRPIGEDFRPALDTALHEGAAETVILDFANVDMMDASFADEVFGNLPSTRGRRAPSTACLVLRNLSTAPLQNLEMALQSRPVRETGLRNCVVMVLVDSDVRLVGKVEDHVRETFEVLQVRERLTARQLADERRLDITAASTRLKVLYDLGLASRVETRDERGKLYIYERPL